MKYDFEYVKATLSRYVSNSIFKKKLNNETHCTCCVSDHAFNRKGCLEANPTYDNTSKKQQNLSLSLQSKQ